MFKNIAAAGPLWPIVAVTSDATRTLTIYRRHRRRKSGGRHELRLSLIDTTVRTQDDQVSRLKGRPMPFDPSAQPWLNARVLVAECGDEAVPALWWYAQTLPPATLAAEMPALLATVDAIRTLRELGCADATVH